MSLGPQDGRQSLFLSKSGLLRRQWVQLPHQPPYQLNPELPGQPIPPGPWLPITTKLSHDLSFIPKTRTWEFDRSLDPQLMLS